MKQVTERTTSGVTVAWWIDGDAHAVTVSGLGLLERPIRVPATESETLFWHPFNLHPVNGGFPDPWGRAGLLTEAEREMPWENLEEQQVPA